MGDKYLPTYRVYKRDDMVHKRRYIFCEFVKFGTFSVSTYNLQHNLFLFFLKICVMSSPKAFFVVRHHSIASSNI